MQAVVQRVSQGSVAVAGRVVGSIEKGLVVLLGVASDDTEKAADWLAQKITHLRIFEDDMGKMNRSLLDIRGEMLVVSQFTIMGDCRKGRRPSFAKAAPPDKAETLYRHFVRNVAQLGIGVATGQFRAAMQVSLVNDGPVTLIVSSPG
jgi:D-tyrosyl-tRNA(Tyr) deacylase